MFTEAVSSEGDELIRLHRDHVVPGYTSYKILEPETKKLVQETEGFLPLSAHIR
jgi:hypothetical protein